MEEMTIRVPVTIKSKLTETLKETLLGDIQNRMNQVDHDLSQLEFQAKGMLAEQAKIDVQGMVSLRAQIEQKKAQMAQAKAQMVQDKEHLEKLTIGAELPRGQMNRTITIHVGDDMNRLMGGEILVEDGKIIAFRD